MSDREKIQELMATYAFSIDNKDYDMLATCFTHGAITSYRGGAFTLTGGDQIIAHMRKVLDALDATQHSFSNFLIKIDGEVATFTCNMQAAHVKRGAPGGDEEIAGGQYSVEARRNADGWKIARIAGRRIWATGNHNLVPKG